jgi:hypothetical protein
MYNHRDKSKYSLQDCEASVGKVASLFLSGKIIDAGESTSGAYVKFLPDERYGFGSATFTIDLDALDVDR